ncbi:pentapeptide repeat-containing protein, partial [bacterium]|nr:pentapeptide repeat-containing protein [bacterium]
MLLRKLLAFFTFLFLASLTIASAQIGPNGTGFVNGYFIGPNANLSGADLSNADLSNADLSNADLSNAYLYGVDL